MARVVQLKKSLKISIKKAKVLKRLGYSKEEPKEEISKAIDGIIKDAEKLITPKGIYTSYNLQTIDWGIYLQKWHKEVYFQSFFLSKKLEHATKAYLFVVSVGNKLEDAIKKAFDEKDYLRGYVLDCIGSEAAENSAQALQELIEKEEKYKMVRYSPGYNDWDLYNQKKIFKELNPKSIGVKLTSSYLMVPRKSVSGIMAKKAEEKG